MSTRWLCVLLLWALLLPGVARAYTGVTIVMSAATPSNLEFVERFKEELSLNRTQTLKVTVLDVSENDKLVVAENSELVIALGVKALAAASRLKHTTPVLGVFTPIPAFNDLLEKSKRDLGIFSAIVIDQPYGRQISLVKAILPQSKRVGVLVGPTSARYGDLIQDQGESAGMVVNIESVRSETELIPKLKTVLDSNESLLAIPDPTIYSRETAQPVLLTSYRYQKPVFGYSQSYVKAGALAAVYSSPSDFAKQAVEIALAAQQPPGLLPPPQAPKYYSIQINHQVARSLNIPIVEESEVRTRMLQLETQMRAETER